MVGSHVVWCGWFGDTADVHVDGALWELFLNWDEMTEKLSVSQGNSARSVNLYTVLVVLKDFDDDSCLVPFCGVWTSLILYPHMVANDQGW